MKTRWMIWILAAGFAFTLGACSALIGPSGERTEAPAEPAESTSPSSIPDTPTEEIIADKQSCEDPFDGTSPAFQTEIWETNFCLHSVPYDEILSGGPPPDGIPPIDSPTFESVSSADAWLEDQEPVVLLDLEGTARAYPLQIMTWHEIVNDEVAGIPVVVTFCPLCNTALVFIRPEIDGELLTFGTSGNLRNSDLVMWDRQTQSWWQQFTGEAIVGDLTGTQLEFLPAGIISWADFKTSQPEGEVLSINTGFNRSYGRNPYPGYDDVNSLPFAFRGVTDGQLPAMARVVGVQLENGQGAAYPLEVLQESQVINEEIGSTPVALFWKAGTSSALDSGSIPDGKDVGTTRVFIREIEGQILSFDLLDSDQFQDQETGSTWSIFGEAVAGPLEGSQLTALVHHDTFWFAWAAFVPDAELAAGE